MRRSHDLVHGAIAAGGEHYLEITAGQRRADGLDVGAGGRLQDHRLPAQLAGELEEATAEIATRSGQCRVEDEERAAPLRVTQARRVSGSINPLLDGSRDRGRRRCADGPRAGRRRRRPAGRPGSRTGWWCARSRTREPALRTSARMSCAWVTRWSSMSRWA